MMSRTGIAAYDEGYQACLDGMLRSECPYPLTSASHEQWLEGWDEAHELADAEYAASPEG